MTLPNGKVFVAGGYDPATGTASNTSEVYDPATNTWTAMGAMTYARGSYEMVVDASGKVFVAAGHGGSAWLNNAERFDPATGLFAAPETLQGAHGYGAAVRSGNGRILTVGGYDVNGNLTAASELD